MKPKTTRVTVSLPTSLVEVVDEVERYIQAYKQQPQTEQEFGWSHHVTLEHLAELPWE